MGVIQSGINQAIQTAAIIGQLQEVPQKRAERNMAADKLEDIEEEKGAFKKYFKELGNPELREEEYETKEKYLKGLRQQENEARLKYQKAGGKEGKYLPVQVDSQERIGEIGVEDFPGQVGVKSEYVAGNVNFDKNKLDEALLIAARQREMAGYVNENLRANIQKALLNMEDYNGK